MIVLLLLVACGRPVSMDAGTPGAGFPHPDGYEEAVHGLDAVATGARCAECHPTAVGGLVNGASTSAPACLECHTWPHDPGFEAGAAHGAAWSARDAECADCHGADGTRAPAGVTAGACTTCHATYPHGSGWTDAAAHGAAVLARGTDAACAGCHGASGDAAPGQACAECHAGYPHPDGWAAGSGHGAAWRAGTGDARCGTACHPVAPDPTGQRPTCQGCHDLFPHAADLSTAHIALTQGRGGLACLTCHAGGDAAGPVLPVTCAPACHQAASVTAPARPR